MCCAQLISYGTMLLVGASLGQVSPGTTGPGLPGRPVIGQGEVTTNDLYVRSGPSLNHYTIAKLNAGDRVNIVGESGDWVEILPPPGTFSLISADYVDSADLFITEPGFSSLSEGAVCKTPMLIGVPSNHFEGRKNLRVAEREGYGRRISDLEKDIIEGLDCADRGPEIGNGLDYIVGRVLCYDSRPPEGKNQHSICKV